MIPCGPKVDITFQSKSNALDSMGAITETWTDLATVLGVFTDRGDSVKFLDGKDTQVGQNVCYVDYLASLDTFLNRVKFNNQYYKITGIHNPMAQNIMLKFDLLLVNV